MEAVGPETARSPRSPPVSAGQVAGCASFPLGLLPTLAVCPPPGNSVPNPCVGSPISEFTAGATVSLTPPLTTNKSLMLGHFFISGFLSLSPLRFPSVLVKNLILNLQGRLSLPAPSGSYFPSPRSALREMLA